MDTFEVLITPDAMDMLTNLSDYILINKQNPSAADDVYQDALETANQCKSSITGTFSGYHIAAMISLFIDELHDLQKLCNAMKEVFACPVSIKLCTR